MKTSTPLHILLFTLIIGASAATQTFGQKVAINPGIDTTDTDIQAVITLWTDYLGTHPNKHNIQDSPFWADTEKKKYPKVDQVLNAINSEDPTYSMGSPTILYVKPQHGFYELKTMFSWTDSLENVFVSCITSVFAKKENGKYKLYNALTVNSQEWQTETMGSVTFHFPKSHTFNKNEANKLLKSIKDLTKLWSLQTIPIDYYFAGTYEEVMQLRGLDYCFGMGNKDKPSGMTDLETKSIFAGGLGENYFHEVVHMYLNNLFPQSPFVEGLAVLYGGSMSHDLKWHLARVNDYLNQHPEINLEDFENFHYMDNFTNPLSSIQGLLCYLANKKGGLDELKKFMSYNDTFVAIEKEFGIKKEGLNEFLREQIRENKEE